MSFQPPEFDAPDSSTSLPRADPFSMMVPAAPQSRNRTAYALGAIGSTLILLLAAILVMLFRTGAGNAASTNGEEVVAPETFTATGSLQVIGSLTKDESGCYGRDGFDDIQPSAQVVIRDSTGEIVAVGALDSGRVPTKFRGLGFMGDPIACSWGFTVEDVPSGSVAYSVEVSHRGEIAFKEENADSLGLSLG